MKFEQAELLKHLAVLSALDEERRDMVLQFSKGMLDCQREDETPTPGSRQKIHRRAGSSLRLVVDNSAEGPQ